MSQAIKDAFDAMKARYKPGVIDAPMSFYFSLGDGEGQKWTMKLTPESCEVMEGKSDADVFLKTDEDRFLKLLTGKWKPGAMDFMRKKISSNDPMKLKLLKDCFGG